MQRPRGERAGCALDKGKKASLECATSSRCPGLRLPACLQPPPLPTDAVSGCTLSPKSYDHVTTPRTRGGK